MEKKYYLTKSKIKLLTKVPLEPDTASTIKNRSIMALTLSKIEAVKFGDFEVIPQMDKEQKLRVRNLKIDQDNYEDAIDVLCRCFGSENSEKVREFMARNMFYMDFIRLKTYLSQGESGLKSLDERVDKFVEKEVEKKMAEENSGEVNE